MRRRLIIAAVPAALALVMAPTAAHAADGGGGSSVITATLTGNAIGSRSVTLVSPITMSSLASSTTLSSNYAVTVTEATRSGTNPWSVTAVASDLTDLTSDTITADNLSVSARGVIQTLGGGTSTAPVGSQTLDTARTLFSNANQNTSTLYSGAYAASGTVTLAPPDGSKTGVYTGTFTVTLIQ
jgi:hypothetical protein